MHHCNFRERGQSTVLLVLALAGILGISALAVDGGLAYFDRRSAQNAADTAALAAALAHAYGGDWETVALQRAATNGYSNDGINNVVSVFHPPIRGTYAGNSEAIQVIITSTVNSPFVRSVFGEPLRNTVEAVARSRERRNITPGYALYGASPNACKTVFFQGTQATNINGGGVFSNSTASGVNCSSGVQGGSGDITVTGGEIELAGSWNANGGSGSVSPPPTEFVPQADLADVPTPDCSGLPWHGAANVNKPTTLEQGIYSRISISGDPSVIVYMEPGMYCITGSQGISTQGAGKLIGNGILIYMQNGGISIGGNFRMQLSASTDLIDPSGNQWAGMLIYAAPTNHYPIDIKGNTGTTYTGTVYAPGSDCNIEGTADQIVVNSQVICRTVKLSGTAAITVNYDQAIQYMMPVTVELTN